MAVIINDLEVVLDAPKSESTPPAPDQATSSASQPAPMDLLGVIEHAAERAKRLRAH